MLICNDLPWYILMCSISFWNWRGHRSSLFTTIRPISQIWDLSDILAYVCIHRWPYDHSDSGLASGECYSQNRYRPLLLIMKLIPQSKYRTGVGFSDDAVNKLIRSQCLWSSWKRLNYDDHPFSNHSNGNAHVHNCNHKLVRLLHQRMVFISPMLKCTDYAAASPTECE